MGRRIARIAQRQFPRRAGDHLDHAVGDVILHAEEPQRRAALPGRPERRRDDIVGDLLRQRGGIDDHGIDAAGFGNQRHDRTVLGGQRPVDDPAYLRRAGEGDAGNARIGGQRRADLAVAGHEMQRARRHPGLMKQPHRLRRDQRGLLGGLRHHAVAGSERRGHLAEEDRQREIPRTDADEHAAAAIGQLDWIRRSAPASAAEPGCAALRRRSSGSSRPPPEARRARRRASCRPRLA